MHLDYRYPNDLKNSAKAAKLKTRISEERVYIFLAGLDHCLDQVCSCVLANVPLPSLEATYAMVRQVAKCQVTMAAESIIEASALTLIKSPPQLVPVLPRIVSHFLSHYNRKNHDEATCWQLVGYPDWFKLKQAECKTHKSSQAHSISTDTPLSSASQVSSSGGNNGMALLSSTKSWIIDFGLLIL